jgi:hypothetical protein
VLDRVCPTLVRIQDGAQEEHRARAAEAGGMPPPPLGGMSAPNPGGLVRVSESESRMRELEPQVDRDAVAAAACQNAAWPPCHVSRAGGTSPSRRDNSACSPGGAAVSGW